MINAKEKVDSLVKSGQLRLTVIDEELMQIESYENDDTIVRFYTDPEATAEDILRAIELGRNAKECVHRR
ncbi:MAG: hypothetical protein PT942_07625 [Eubacteriales bacterium]|nr:hypothetical protein [Eubacteriales bacterium]